MRNPGLITLICLLTNPLVLRAAEPVFQIHVIGNPEGRNLGQSSAVDIGRDGNIDILTKP